jgi:drug/metabolite transporter (DMT)-like permease
VLLDLPNVTSLTTLTPYQAIGIPIALSAAIFLSLGAQFQHRGVSRVGELIGGMERSSLSIRQLLALFRRPSWVIGTLFLGFAVLLQLTSLIFAPLIVVQPLGAVALVVTAVVNSRVSKVKLHRASIRAIAFCVGGVGLFVTIAAFTAHSFPITETQLVIVLAILIGVLIVFGILFAFLRTRITAIFYIVGAGVLFGFVVTLAKVVIDRIHTLILIQFKTDSVEWLTITCVVALLLAAALGSYFVQSAYASGPPDLVVAGLTVIDPFVAIAIGITVLGEAATAPIWAIIAFAISGALAIYGVLLLSRNHPQSQH